MTSTVLPSTGPEANTAVAGDPGDADDCALLEPDLRRQRHGVLRGHDDVLRGGAERPVGLREAHPDAFADAPGVGTRAGRVDRARAVPVRDHARVGHGRTPVAAAFADVTDAHSGHRDAHPHLPRPRFGLGHLADPGDLVGGTLLFVAGRAHRLSSSVIRIDDRPVS
ncbi:hypothetical protein [Amycolatopsis sp. FDAARGOS 1241]|uniref:hypothetical protein n=1 Tax=Amycolatopsis sp. FDAARGOS 1241 TaxID=2778070 RepID=UPI00195154EF|nr:hypothetical protein [Amycolatopsis sp. FDAARGOS 1241]QRP49379.1 hypothetical protein I6J71_17420 [Amycolatopsis sp. FDAARGOS 1241]